jgi:hypothetical protein
MLKGTCIHTHVSLSHTYAHIHMHMNQQDHGIHILRSAGSRDHLFTAINLSSTYIHICTSLNHTYAHIHMHTNKIMVYISSDLPAQGAIYLQPPVSHPARVSRHSAPTSGPRNVHTNAPSTCIAQSL